MTAIIERNADRKQSARPKGRSSQKLIWFSLVALAVASLSLTHSSAQTPQENRQLRREQTQQSNSVPERRIALVIGNGTYTNAPALKNPPNDAHDMAAMLKTLGFEVASGVNVNQREMKRLIREFGQKLKSGGSGLFYYAGHGVQSKGRNYLIPIDADIQSEAEVEDSGVDVGLVLNYMDDAQNGLNIVILDACRNNPFARSFRSAADGLAQVDAPTGTLIAYATAPGRVASDGSGENGLYTSELLRQMRVPDVSATDLFMRVRANVMKQTGGKQVPWEASSLVGTFSFNATNAGPTAPIRPTSLDQVAVKPDHFPEATSNPPTNAKTTAKTSKLDLPTALMLLDRSMHARDGSMQGQVVAIESLLAQGYEFNSSNLSGISFRDASLRKGIFNKARLHAVDLRKVDASGANLSESGLRFANLEEGIFAEADLSNTYAPFIWGKAADFEKANLAAANFFCADLRGTNFSNANLRGASFAFADLRGAKFDGADMTGAYLPGAVLDGASFVNTIINNTDFTGAAAEHFTLSHEQIAGACRHHSHAHGYSDDGWHVKLYSQGETDYFAYDSFDFALANDRSLSLCTTKPLDESYNGTIGPIVGAIFIDDVSASKAGRKEAFRDRLKEHIVFLKATLTTDRLLKGEGIQSKGWDAVLRNAVKNTSPISKPYYNTDLMLVTLLRGGVLEEKAMDWEFLAKNYHSYESFVREEREGDFAHYLMWSPIFPPIAWWTDLTEDTTSLYRGWTLARESRAPEQVIVRLPLDFTKNDSSTLSLETLGIGEKGDHDSKAEEKGISIERTVYLDANLGQTNRGEFIRVLFVFPEKLEHLNVKLPEEFKNEGNLKLEMELKIERFDKYQRAETRGSSAGLYAFIFVTPDKVRLLKAGKEVWSGKVQKDTSTIRTGGLF